MVDEEGPVKTAGLIQFSHLAPEEQEEFAAGWHSLPAGRRLQLLDALLDIAEDNVELNFDVVFGAALEDQDPAIRLAGVRGLWECEERWLVKSFIHLLRMDSSAEVRAEAALALGRFVLLAEERDLPERYSQPVQDALKEAVENEGETEEVRARALEAAANGALSDWIRQAIIEAYEDDSRRRRVSAVHSMGGTCDSRWLPLLYRELRSDEAEIRYEAARACGAISNEAAVSHVEPLLQDEDAEVRDAATFALGEIGGEEARALLAALLKDSSPAVRQTAAAALNLVDFEDDPLAVKFHPDE